MTCGSVGLDDDMWQCMMEQREAPKSLASFERLMAMFDRGDFDLIGVGRGMIAEPRWAAIVRSGDLDQLKSFSPSMIDMRRSQDDAPSAAALHDQPQ